VDEESAPRPIPLAVQADVAVEIGVNAMLTIGWTVAAILMFRHKRAFVWLWFVLVITLSGRNLASVYFAPQTVSAKDRSAIVRSLLMPAVWVPYMLGLEAGQEHICELGGGHVFGCNRAAARNPYPAAPAMPART
jgi:Protein of unknown function (DUF2569)